MSDIKVGDHVDYHSVIGGPVTSTGHVVESLQLQPGMRGTRHPHGYWVAFITGKRGWVGVEALTLTAPAREDGGDKGGGNGR